jgi:hypothetical protein
LISLSDDLVYTNTDSEVELETFEFQLSTQSFNGLSFGVSAALTEAENKGDDLQLSHIPESLYKGLLRYWHPSRRFGGDINIRYVGNVYGTNYEFSGCMAKNRHDRDACRGPAQYAHQPARLFFP